MLIANSDTIVIKIWELDARSFLDKELLLPIILMMKGGLSLVTEADRFIYEKENRNRADDLSILGIMKGILDRQQLMNSIKEGGIL